MPTFDKILIANRGEIACRIMRTCRRMGIRTVAVYSDADANSAHVRAADEAVHIGGAAPSASYLRGDVIIQAAQRTGAQAIHPGFGFLAENAGFAQAVAYAGLVFIGPRPEVIAQMGSKIGAKMAMQAVGVPTVPGYQGDEQTDERLQTEALRIGFPLLVKASAGGGGKGMRIVHKADGLAEALQGARREAESAFGDGTLLLERYFEHSRHIEVQVLGDQHGNVVHLHERECSIQRRYQKVIEEAPSPSLPDTARHKLLEAAVRGAQAIGYTNAGTFEFIVDEQSNFYFLEVNTRLQVEHPVTEAILGLDLVALQIAVAEGQPLPFSQADLRPQGHAIECRLYAEDALNSFLPATGPILRFDAPALPGLRYDSGIETGDEIGIHYDPMISKVIAHGDDRPTALRRMRTALAQLVALGSTTNQRFLQAVLHEPAFVGGHYNTGFIAAHATHLTELQALPATAALEAAAVALALRLHALEAERPALTGLPLGWRNNPYRDPSEKFRIQDTELELAYRQTAASTYTLTIDGQEHNMAFTIDHGEDQSVALTLDGHRRVYPYAQSPSGTLHVHHPEGGPIAVEPVPVFVVPGAEAGGGGCTAPMPGQVARVLVEPGQAVKNGDSLVVLLSMKMEHTLYAPSDAVVEDVLVAPGDFVEAGAALVRLQAET